MKCRKCGKDIVKALELFNGDLRCPGCGAGIVPGEGDLDVTRDNDELYRLSRANFFTYLERASGQSEKTTDKEKKETSGYLERAVEFCGNAANALHPEAIVDLGYYYSKNYVNEDVVGVGRYKTAYSYFRCIIDPNNFDDLHDKYAAYFRDNGIAGSPTDEAARVATKAAYYMLDMISSAPEELTEQPEYSLAKAKELIESNKYIKIGDMGDFAFRTAAEEAADKMKRISKTLERCKEKSSSHSPLFGYFEITPDEYYGVKALSAKYPKGIVMGLLYEQGGYMEWAGIGNSEAERIMNGDPGLKLYFYFFNQGSASKVYKKGFKASSLEDVVIDNGTQNGMAEIVSASGKKEQIFYWDDGYFVSANKGKLKREAGKENYSSIISGFLMLSSGEYTGAWEK
ncbi:MAG: hypothetical protein LUE27_02315 [Clostridia bacterium]|nr:hypothetical protein [Clostridia bacterium]